MAQEKFFRDCQFLLSASAADQLPNHVLPEIAFAGRSNVGKSTLINAAVGQRIAKASSTPGRTRLLNMFCIAEALYVVDLPGYGFAKASKGEIDGWNEMVFDYLVNRPQLRRVFLLIDARRGIMDNDKEVMRLLDNAAVSYQIVLTKIDKLNPAEVDTVISSVKAQFSEYTALYPELIVTSAQKKKGMDELHAAMKQIISPK